MIHSRRQDNGDNFDTIQSQGIGIDGELGIDGGVSVECNAQICFQNLQTTNTDSSGSYRQREP